MRGLIKKLGPGLLFAGAAIGVSHLVQSTRAVARGPVAKAVAEGARNTHDWTETKASILKSFDESGII